MLKEMKFFVIRCASECTKPKSDTLNGLDGNVMHQMAKDIERDVLINNTRLAHGSKHGYKEYVICYEENRTRPAILVFFHNVRENDTF